MPEHEAERFSTLKEYGLDFAARNILVSPILDLLEELNPELFKAVAYYAVKDRTKLEVVVALMNSLIEAATNLIPFVRRNRAVRAIKNELLGQIPRAIGAYFNERKNLTFEEGYEPQLKSSEELRDVALTTVRANIPKLREKMVRALTDAPRKFIQHRGGRDWDEHLRALSSLTVKEFNEWFAWVATLSDDEQRFLRDLRPSLGDKAFLRRLLKLPADQRITFLKTYSKTWVEDQVNLIVKGVGGAVRGINESVTPLLTEYSRKRRAENAKLDREIARLKRQLNS